MSNQITVAFELPNGTEVVVTLYNDGVNGWESVTVEHDGHSLPASFTVQEEGDL